MSAPSARIAPPSCAASSPADADMQARFGVRIQTAPIDPHTEPALPEGCCGAQVRFIGKVRGHAQHTASALTHLVLEHFPSVTEGEITRILALARQRWALLGAQVVHRTGRIAAGEDIVMVTTHSAHRRDAYEANVFIMDYLKSEAPFWKQECFADGSAHWVEAKASDQAARQRWQSAGAVSTTAQRRVGALVLAGGQGRRMGGINKGLQPLRGRPLVQHVIEAVRPQVDALYISANQDQAAYGALGQGLPVIGDAAAYRDLGPLAGIASTVPHMPPDLDAILVVPCDTPNLPADLVARLAAQLFTPGAAPAAMASTSVGPQPSVVLFRPGIFFSLIEHLQQQRGLSLRSWLHTHGCAAVHFDEAQAFANVNDAHTLAQLQA